LESNPICRKQFVKLNIQILQQGFDQCYGTTLAGFPKLFR